MNPNINTLTKWIFTVTVILMSLVSTVQAIQGYKISHELTPTSTLDAYKISADGKFVVYMEVHFSEIGNLLTTDLFSVPIAGGVITKLSAGALDNFVISPDGSTVVFETCNSGCRLFSIPIGGGPVVQLSSIRAKNFQISKNSTHVIYLDNAYDASAFPISESLYSVPIGGGAITKLNPESVVNGAQISWFQISPDSKYVVYSGIVLSDGTSELFRVLINGGNSERLNSDLVAGGDVSGFAFSDNGTRVIYKADQLIDQVSELFSVSITGGEIIRLNPNLAIDEDVYDFVVNADGGRVLFRVGRTIVSPINRSSRAELFSVPTIGGDAVRLHPNLMNNESVGTYSISPDSQRAVYTVESLDDYSVRLFSATVSGGSNVQLNPNSSIVERIQFDISPDSSKVVFSTRQFRFSGLSNLFSVNTSGGGPLVLLNSDQHTSGVNNARISPNSAWVTYTTTPTSPNPFNSPAVEIKPISGGGEPPFSFASSSSRSSISPDGSFIVYYLADGYRIDGNIRYSLYAATMPARPTNDPTMPARPTSGLGSIVSAIVLLLMGEE